MRKKKSTNKLTVILSVMVIVTGVVAANQIISIIGKQNNITSVQSNDGTITQTQNQNTGTNSNDGTTSATEKTGN